MNVEERNHLTPMIDVTCAIIVNQAKQVLITQRSATMKLPFKWEFPGGKVESGESPEACVVREIKEELNLDINPGMTLQLSIHHYPEFSINLIPFICEIMGGEIILSEHTQYLWLDPAELLNLDWAEADIPIVKNYIELIKIEL